METKYLARYRRIVQTYLHKKRSLKSHFIMYIAIVQQMNRLYLSTLHVLIITIIYIFLYYFIYYDVYKFLY